MQGGSTQDYAGRIDFGADRPVKSDLHPTSQYKHFLNIEDKKIHCHLFTYF